MPEAERVIRGKSSEKLPTDPAVAAERDRRFLEGGKEEMVNLSPGLGPGAHTGTPPAGEIYPQPLLPDGRRLDASIGGYRFALLAPPHLLQEFHGEDVALVQTGGEEALLLRPDRYIAGVSRSAAGVRALQLE